jgi:hypothetical protein
VEGDDAPGRQEGEDWISPLREELAGVAPDDREAIIQLIALYREFPVWAVWRPYRGHGWIAVRPASSRAPGPDLPMVWVHGQNAAELSRRMSAVDGQLASP